MARALKKYFNQYGFQLFIFGAGLLVYFNSLFNEFVWEDLSLIISDPMGHSFNIFSPENSFNLEGQFRPVTALYSAIAYTFFGESPFFYHLIQVCMHIANTILIFTLFSKFLKKHISLFVSLLFLIHPLNVESVSYIGSYNTPLFVLFGLSALLINTSDNFRSRLFPLFIMLLGSVFSKETGMLFLIIIPLYSFLFKRKHVLYSAMISVCVLVVYIVTKILAGVQLAPSYPAPISQLPAGQRFISIPAVLLYYIKIFFLPVQFAVYQRWVISSPTVEGFIIPVLLILISIAVLIISGIYVIKIEKRMFSVYLFFLIWFIAGMLLHSQIIPLNLTVSDHWFYFPMIGLCGLIGLLIQVLNIEKQRYKRLIFTAAVLLILVFSIRTIVRNSNWHNNMTLFTHDSQVMDNYLLEDFLGTEFFYRKQYQQSLEHYYKTLRLYPREDAYLSIATVYKYSGNFGEAKEFYNRAIKNQKNYLLDSYRNLSAVMLIDDPPEQSKEFITNALKKYPDDNRLWAYYSLAEYKLDNHAEALIASEKAKNIKSDALTEYVYSAIMQNQSIDSNYVLFPDDQ